MKTQMTRRFLFAALIAGFALTVPSRIMAQTLRTLHAFTVLSTNLSNATNSDGAKPQAGLILSGNTLYGTASGGGNAGLGTVFAVNTDGTGFTVLHTFTALSGPSATNSDGANPSASLILSSNTLYGTASAGVVSAMAIYLASIATARAIPIFIVLRAAAMEASLTLV